MRGNEWEPELGSRGMGVDVKGRTEEIWQRNGGKMGEEEERAEETTEVTGRKGGP